MSNNLIPDAAVQAIKDSEKTEVIEVRGASFVTRPVYDPPREPVPATVKINTLTGLIDYVNRGPDVITGDENGLMIHVVNERQVDVASGLFGRAEQRRFYASATSRKKTSDRLVTTA